MATATLIGRQTISYLTEQEFMNLPDNGRKYELVDGKAKFVPTGHEHEVIMIGVASTLRSFAKGIGFVAGSQAGFRMESGNVRSPDVSFMRKERLPDGRPSKGFEQDSPDLCIEVISPSEERADMQQKVREYFASGATYVWQMFPETRRIVVFTSPIEWKTLESDDTIDAGDLLPGFTARVGDLFELE